MSLFATLNTPAKGAVAVTPSDSADLTAMCRGIYVGVGGDVVAILENGTTAVTFKNAASGQILPVCATRIYSTGTTATNLVVLY